MAAGLVMGTTQDFTAAPAHAHLNLLGWVSMALMGLYYRGAPPARLGLAWTQVAVGVAGFWIFPVALGAYLVLDAGAAFAFIIAGSVMAIASFVLFAAVVLLDIRDRAARFPAYLPESG
jgi:hypothetical protein